jgi:hypothetical protein
VSRRRDGLAPHKSTYAHVGVAARSRGNRQRTGGRKPTFAMSSLGPGSTCARRSRVTPRCSSVKRASTWTAAIAQAGSSPTTRKPASVEMAVFGRPCELSSGHAGSSNSRSQRRSSHDDGAGSLPTIVPHTGVRRSVPNRRGLSPSSERVLWLEEPLPLPRLCGPLSCRTPDRAGTGADPRFGRPICDQSANAKNSATAMCA